MGVFDNQGDWRSESNDSTSTRPGFANAEVDVNSASGSETNVSMSNHPPLSEYETPRGPPFERKSKLPMAFSPKDLRHPVEDGPEFGSSIVKIHLGEFGPYHVHEPILRSSSKFFTSELDQFQEHDSEKCVFIRSSYSTKAFQTYMKWLYTGRLFLLPEPQVSNGYDRDAMERQFWIECYELANSIQDPDFKDALVDAVIEYIKHSDYSKVSLGSIIYKNSEKGSPARQLIVDQSIHDYDLYDYKRISEHGDCSEFVSDLLLALAEVYTGSKKANYHPRWVRNTCIYHEHSNSGGLCYKEKRSYLFSLDKEQSYL